MAERDNIDAKADLEERIERIAGAVKDYLREGETFMVRCEDDDIIVEEGQSVRLEKEHKRLYGRLISLNDQLESGCGANIAAMAAGGLFCLGLHVGWWDNLLTANVADTLKTWWFYVPFFAGLFFLSDVFYGFREKRLYRRGRDELFALLRDEGFDRDTLVPLIKNDPAFERICKQLKRDPGPFRSEDQRS